MAAAAEKTNIIDECSEPSALKLLAASLDEALEDLEYGRVQSLEDAWKDIDAV